MWLMEGGDRSALETSWPRLGVMKKSTVFRKRGDEKVLATTLLQKKC
jgi:hypothetical protein